MMIQRSKKTALISALTGIFLTLSGAAMADCLSGEQARSAVDSGQALPIANFAGGLGGEVVKVQMCRQGSQLVYVVGVLQSNGQVIRRVVDARSGQVLQ